MPQTLITIILQHLSQSHRRSNSSKASTITPPPSPPTTTTTTTTFKRRKGHFLKKWKKSRRTNQLNPAIVLNIPCLNRQTMKQKKKDKETKWELTQLGNTTCIIIIHEFLIFYIIFLFIFWFFSFCFVFNWTKKISLQEKKKISFLEIFF